jgi:hypothetical protein
MRRIVQIFWAVVAAIIVIPVAGGWFSEFAKEKGLYEHPSENAEAVMNWLSSFVSQPIYWGVAGLFIGIAFGMWMDSILKSKEKDERKIEETFAERSELVLLAHGGQKHVTMVSHVGVWRWYSLVQIGIGKNVSGEIAQEVLSTTIFISFDEPVNVGTMEISADHVIPTYEVKRSTVGSLL